MTKTPAQLAQTAFELSIDPAVSHETAARAAAEAAEAYRAEQGE